MSFFGRCSSLSRSRAAWLLVAGAAACSASASPTPPAAGSGGTGVATGGSGGSGASGGTAIATGGTGNVISTDPQGGASEPQGGACAVATAEPTLVREPIDIILALDNSGSMDDELEAVENNINVNFASILEASGVDYRVILISRHRQEAREDSSSAATSVCVTSPLSGNATCPAPQPVFGERFFHYSSKIESDDSFDIVLDTYLPPFESDDNEDKYEQAPLGWSEWLRPNAKKVFLELTDDNEDMTADAFVDALTTMAPEHFGSALDPNFIFHSIIGIAPKETATDPYLADEPVNDATCENVTTAGRTYQELSVRTGGLRFPICQFAAYDVVFRTIAEDVVVSAEIACDFAIPPPPDGTTLDLTTVAVEQTDSATGAVTRYGQALTSAECQEEAFYIEADRIYLCPQACDALHADAGASVEVLFTCESTIILR